MYCPRGSFGIMALFHAQSIGRHVPFTVGRSAVSFLLGGGEFFHVVIVEKLAIFR